MIAAKTLYLKHLTITDGALLVTAEERGEFITRMRAAKTSEEQ